MQFTAVVAASLVCASSVSAFMPFSFLGAPSQMSGCGNQAGMINIGALNNNNCVGGAGIGGMSCGNQGGLINVGLLSSVNCANMNAGAGPLFSKNEDTKKADNSA
ncbi:putative signal peptide protein [Puccinia sorghi]|uniref:Putative signal peptide protein n=1 Tax=Puccinia sorghi TaxID=27349 RepID=A0A0L6VAV0_9BASI|nr:putative signal peptide protein [Puccinia sorghi]